MYNLLKIGKYLDSSISVDLDLPKTKAVSTLFNVSPVCPWGNVMNEMLNWEVIHCEHVNVVQL